jgi:hypothetical protein
MPYQDLWMPCRDGIALATRIWRPDGDGPWPVLLMRQPYGRAIASTVTYAHPSWYADRGFLVAVQDVRGRGDSQGEFAGFAQEAADGADAVRWCRRLAGASGRVGTYGFSYQGFTQLLGEASAEAEPGSLDDPLPDCLAPAMCGLDERLHWASEGGAHWWSLGLGWALQLAAQGAQRRGDAEGWSEIRRSLESGTYLHDGMELLRRQDPDGMGFGWLQRDPRRPEGWQVHPLPVALLRRPMLLIGGWLDPHLLGVIDLAERSLASGGHPSLCIGAWSHLDWRGGIDRLQLAFFCRHLRGEAPGAWKAEAGASTSTPEDLRPASLAFECPRSGSWRTVSMLSSPAGAAGALNDTGALDETGALHKAAAGPWWLSSEGLAAISAEEGTLLSSPSSEVSGLTLVHDPWRPVPSRGGHLGPDPGLCERADLDRRADVAVFQTAPLETPISLFGSPRLQIAAAADQPGFDLWAALSVVRSDGTVLQLCTGVLRSLGEEALPLQPRLLRLQPTAISLAAGERLRLSLAGSAWPAIAVNPGTGSLPRGGSAMDHRVISIALDPGSARLWFEPLLGAN